MYNYLKKGAGLPMRMLEQFLLEIPYLFLKKIPYAWVGVAAFWVWPPLASSLLMLLVLLGLAMMAGQNRAWENKIRREFHTGPSRPYIDHPHAARMYQVRNLTFVLAASAFLGWLLHGRFGLSGPQWALLLAGVMLLYKDAYLFGASTTYMITDQGVGIRYVPGHVDYRLFFRFHEIRRAERIKTPERIPRRWDVLVPKRFPQEGVLLYAVRPEGFSKQIQSEVFLAPTDIVKFLEALDGHGIAMQTVSASPG
jgi:hypothetical protein